MIDRTTFDIATQRAERIKQASDGVRRNKVLGEIYADIRHAGADERVATLVAAALLRGKIRHAKVKY